MTDLSDTHCNLPDCDTPLCADDHTIFVEMTLLREGNITPVVKLKICCEHYDSIMFTKQYEAIKERALRNTQN